MPAQDREQRKAAEEMQKQLAESIAKLQQQTDDPKSTPQQREQMRKAAQKLQKAIDAMKKSDDSRWQQLVADEEAKRLLRALANGESVPDQQWNKLMSSLGDGLWQVRRANPPEEYRKPIEQYQEIIGELMNTIDEA